MKLRRRLIIEDLFDSYPLKEVRARMAWRATAVRLRLSVDHIVDRDRRRLNLKEERKFAAGKAFAKTANSAERRRSEEAKPKPERAEREWNY